MMEFSTAIANRIARFIADGRSFFTIQRFHGMPPSRVMRHWTLSNPAFRALIDKARSLRQPRAPRSDDPATWGIYDDQIEFSAQHGGIVPVEVKVLGKKTRQQGLRRAPDAQMFDSFTAPQERAFYRIAAAQKAYIIGMGYRPSSLIRVDRSHNGDWEEVRAADLKADYDRWRVDCRNRRLDAERAMDIMGLGMNLSESADQRGLPRAAVRDNLIACLTAFCDRKGW